jgi:hypothetical protein
MQPLDAKALGAWAAGLAGRIQSAQHGSFGDHLGSELGTLYYSAFNMGESEKGQDASVAQVISQTIAAPLQTAWESYRHGDSSGMSSGLEAALSGAGSLQRLLGSGEAKTAELDVRALGTWATGLADQIKSARYSSYGADLSTKLGTLYYSAFNMGEAQKGHDASVAQVISQTIAAPLQTAWESYGHGDSSGMSIGLDNASEGVGSLQRMLGVTEPPPDPIMSIVTNTRSPWVVPPDLSDV